MAFFTRGETTDCSLECPRESSFKEGVVDHLLKGTSQSFTASLIRHNGHGSCVLHVAGQTAESSLSVSSRLS